MVQWLKDLVLSARIAAVVRVQSLAQELVHAEAKKKGGGGRRKKGAIIVNPSVPESHEPSLV